MNSSHHTELTQLFNEYANGQITAGRLHQLEEILREDPEARQAYLDYFRVHATLYDFVDDLADCEELALPEHPPAIDHEANDSRTFSMPQLGVLLAVCGVVLCLIVLPLWGIWIGSDRNFQELTGNPLTQPNTGSASNMLRLPKVAATVPIAIVSRMIDVKMTPGEPMLSVGQGLTSQQFSMQSGLMQLDFLNGVSVIVEGKVELNLISQNQCELLRGQARVYAPSPEDGFVLITQHATFIDRGTEFGVRVLPDQKAEMHVFDGQVDVLPRAGNQVTQSLTTGRGISIAPQAPIQEIVANDENFPSMVNVGQRISELEQQRLHDWQASRQEVLSDKDLVVYFDFEPDAYNSQRVTDRSGNGQDGVIVGCNLSQGRWPGKKALEFKGPHDRMRMNIPGEFDSLTLAVWVRLDGYDRQFNSIMLTDKFEDGHVHWQVRSNGIIDMGMKPKDERRLLYLSNSVLGFQDLGRWTHLAAVLDRDQGVVIHYLDGHQVARIPIETGIESEQREPVAGIFPLRIGRAELGNWRPDSPERDNGVRNLNGRIDEFAIYSKALSKAEIERLYTLGRP